MSAGPSGSSFAASCTQCGGVVPVRLSGPTPRCPFCGTERPLAPELAGRVDELRERLARQTRRERQLVGKQAELGATYGYPFLIVILCVWAVLGGATLLPLVEVPPGWSTWTFLTVEYRADEIMDGHVMGWWACYALALGFWLTVALWLAVLVSLRRVVRWAFPQPPDAPGRPPRCRCCGAELGVDGVVRRCGYCDADNVVRGERDRKRQLALDGALHEMEAQLEDTLAARNRRVERLFGVAGGLPLVVALGAPLLSLLLTHTEPRAWVVPGGLVVVSALLVAWARRWRPVEIPSLEYLQAGDAVFVRGVKLRVLGITTVPGSSLPLHWVGAADVPSAAFEVELDEAGIPSATVFDVSAGGEALGGAEIARGELLELRRGRGVGALDGRVWGLADTRAEQLVRVRIVLGSEGVAGQSPTFTATRAGPLGEADLSAIAPGSRPTMDTTDGAHLRPRTPA